MKLWASWIFTCVLLWSCTVYAQQNAKPSAANPTSAGGQRTPRGSEPDKAEGHERILGVIPAFGVTNRQNAAPLTSRQKFGLFARSAVDPFAWFAAGMQAGISQAYNNFPEYGQGAAGYGKRFGAAMADSADSDFFSNFFYPVLLKQDPRYFRLGHGSFKHRLAYAISRDFWSRTDNGYHRFNYPNVMAAFTTGAISNTYYPPSDRGLGLTMSRSAISLAYGMAGGLGLEFWPDISRKLFHKKR
ncbi:MAG TPA: hypothetical protein VFM10_05790 [Terriglobales bacterium]|jgi:hypothetical protein|nr:hypothetical protein [Terriglobales bacterium]